MGEWNDVGEHANVDESADAKVFRNVLIILHRIESKIWHDDESVNEKADGVECHHSPPA